MSGKPETENYTTQTRDWLDQRYELCDLRGELNWDTGEGEIDGIYHAHQPVYGLWSNYCEPGRMQRYAITWQLLCALQELPFRSLLDAGAAEGYTQALIQTLFSTKTVGVDLSPKGCLRSREIHHLHAAAADLHSLPFREESFDAVVCSETLEHVYQPTLAVKEMLRVARIALVLSVPQEKEETIRSNLQEGIPHAHIHRFTPDCFDEWRRQGFQVRCRPVLSASFMDLGASLERFRAHLDQNFQEKGRFSDIIRQAIYLDETMACKAGSGNGWICTILKPGGCFLTDTTEVLDPAKIIDWAYPLHRLHQWTFSAWQSAASRSDALLFHFDTVQKSQAGLSLAGWAFMEKSRAEFQRIAVALRSARRYYLFAAHMLDRQDVEQHFASADYRHSGFEVFIPGKHLLPGEYRVELVVKNRDAIFWRPTDVEWCL